MKKTHQTIISILSLILILTFTGSASAEDACIIKWWADSDTCIEESIMGVWPTCEEMYTSINTFSPAGIIATTETSRNQASAIALFMEINGYDPHSIESSCVRSYSYFNTDGGEDEVDNRVCLDGSWSRYRMLDYGGIYHLSMEASGGWNVICGSDADGDTLPDSEDSDTVFGTISGDIQEGVNVGIYRPNCGGDILVDTTSTDEQGYYAFGNLGVGYRTILPELEGYTFIPEADYPKMPQTVIKSYDFTATSTP